MRRPGPGAWDRDGRPEYLRQQAIKSRERPGLEQIGLWQLHSIDPKVPRDEQFAAVKSLQDDGVIRHAGLSNVSVADIEAASKVFKVATVQNLYNLVDRGSEDVLDYCDKNGIGFVPWYPLAAGRLAKSGSILDAVAKAHEESDAPHPDARWLQSRVDRVRKRRNSIAKRQRYVGYSFTFAH